jgi:hypothetical protein
MLGRKVADLIGSFQALAFDMDGGEGLAVQLLDQAERFDRKK